MTGPEALAAYSQQLHAVSGTWLQSRPGPELSYSLGTLSTLTDPDITVGLAFAAGSKPSSAGCRFRRGKGGPST